MTSWFDWGSRAAVPTVYDKASKRPNPIGFDRGPDIEICQVVPKECSEAFEKWVNAGKPKEQGAK